MSTHQLHVHESFNAPAATVFDRLADHNRMGEYMSADIRRTKDSTAAGEGPNGTGSVRTLKILGLSDFDETVVKYVKPAAVHGGTRVANDKDVKLATLEYKITRGSPLKNHLGVITLKEEAGKTTVDWNITFEMGFGGIIVEFLLKFAVGRGLAKLKKLVEENK